MHPESCVEWGSAPANEEEGGGTSREKTMAVFSKKESGIGDTGWAWAAVHGEHSRTLVSTNSHS